MRRNVFTTAVSAVAALAAAVLLAVQAFAATPAQVNTAWDATVPNFTIHCIGSLPDSTPLTEVITAGGQSALDAQLSRTAVALGLLATQYPDVDLDSATVGDVRFATVYVYAP